MTSITRSEWHAKSPYKYRYRPFSHKNCLNFHKFHIFSIQELIEFIIHLDYKLVLSQSSENTHKHTYRGVLCWKGLMLLTEYWKEFSCKLFTFACPPKFIHFQNLLSLVRVKISFSDFSRRLTKKTRSVVQCTKMLHKKCLCSAMFHQTDIANWLCVSSVVILRLTSQ